MRDRRQLSEAVFARRIISLGLTLGVTLLAQLAVLMAGAAPSRSFAPRIVAETPSVTISNPIATPPTSTAQPTATKAATATAATTPTSTPSAGSTPPPTPPTTNTASALASLSHVPVDAMSITYNPHPVHSCCPHCP